jgi:hypothetical protein
MRSGYGLLHWLFSLDVQLTVICVRVHVQTDTVCDIVYHLKGCLLLPWKLAVVCSCTPHLLVHTITIYLTGLS